MMITGGQIRMARAALQWSQGDLSANSGVSRTTIQRIEADDGPPSSSRNVEAIQKALEAGGVEFSRRGAPGVRLRSGTGLV